MGTLGKSASSAAAILVLFVYTLAPMALADYQPIYNNFNGTFPSSTYEPIAPMYGGFGSGGNGSGQIISLDMNPRHSLNSSFRVAVREDRVEDAKRFLKDGAELNGASESGDTALMYASRNCSLQLVTYLLSLKADVNVVDSLGRTALMYASMEGCEPVVKLLLKNPEIKVDVQDRFRMSASTYALDGAVAEVGGPFSDIVNQIRRAKRRGSITAQNKPPAARLIQ